MRSQPSRSVTAGSTLAILYLCIASSGAAQIKIDSTSDSAKLSGAVLVSADGEVVQSQLGEVHSVLTIGCRNHNAHARISLIATVAPAVLIHHGFNDDEATIEVRSDSGNNFKLNMEVITMGVRWLLDERNGEVKQMLNRMAAQDKVTIRWKLSNFEDVSVAFRLDSSRVDRQTKLAAPWIACGNKALW